MDKLVKKVNREIVKIAKGKTDALGSLYELTSGYLLSMARVYLGDKSLAEDVVSEVYLKVVKNAYRFNADMNGLNWLYKITKNTSLNINSQRARNVQALDAAMNIADIFDIMSDYNLLKGKLIDEVRRLEKEERHLLYLRYWQGLTIKEIALQIGKSPSYTHDLIKKILKKLKGKI